MKNSLLLSIFHKVSVLSLVLMIAGCRAPEAFISGTAQVAESLPIEELVVGYNEALPFSGKLDNLLNETNEIGQGIQAIQEEQNRLSLEVTSGGVHYEQSAWPVLVLAVAMLIVIASLVVVHMKQSKTQALRLAYGKYKERRSAADE